MAGCGSACPNPAWRARPPSGPASIERTPAWRGGDGVLRTPSGAVRNRVSFLFVGPAEVDLGQSHLLGDGDQLVADLEHAGGPLRGVDAQAGDDQLAERPGDA